MHNLTYIVIKSQTGRVQQKWSSWEKFNVTDCWNNEVLKWPWSFDNTLDLDILWPRHFTGGKVLKFVNLRYSYFFLTFQLMWYMMIWPWPSCTLTFDFLFQEAVSRLGGIDILILNHILPIPLGMWEGSPQNLTITDKIVDVNFKAYVHLTSHALPHLVASNGSIIVVSSLAGLVILLFLLIIIFE